MSITELLEERNRPESRIYGVVVGIITNNQDPDELGRVKVKIPRISGEDESNWARVVSFMAGADRGAFFLPEVDDEVLVAFEYGDINMPYVIGSLWNGKDAPPETNSDGKNNIRVIKSRNGHVIRLDDTDDKGKIEIVDNNENMIIIDTKEEKISIKSNKDIEISAPDGKVTIEANDIEIISNASTKIEASGGMDLKASDEMNIKGATVNLN
jgi:uncharacterized protein involved in type VI secretion and phage assembly